MSGKKNNYGFYGSGLSGYTHYKQSFDRTHDISSAPTRSAFDNDGNEQKTNPESGGQTSGQTSFLQEVIFIIFHIVIPIGVPLGVICALIKAIWEVLFS